MKTPKVFCIGFHKTGTTSMHWALHRLGYRVASCYGDALNQVDTKILTDIADKRLKCFDAFEDQPWPVLYKYLDVKCPGSKFILTVRDSRSWLGSMERQFRSRCICLHEYIYQVKSVRGNQDAYVARFERHNAEVTDYFRLRPNDLLSLDLSHGNTWEKICGFLNIHTIPTKPFPHANKRLCGQALPWFKGL